MVSTWCIQELHGHEAEMVAQAIANARLPQGDTQEAQDEVAKENRQLDDGELSGSAIDGNSSGGNDGTCGADVSGVDALMAQIRKEVHILLSDENGHLPSTPQGVQLNCVMDIARPIISELVRERDEAVQCVDVAEYEISNLKQTLSDSYANALMDRAERAEAELEQMTERFARLEGQEAMLAEEFHELKKERDAIQPCVELLRVLKSYVEAWHKATNDIENSSVHDWDLKAKSDRQREAIEKLKISLMQCNDKLAQYDEAKGGK